MDLRRLSGLLFLTLPLAAQSPFEQPMQNVQTTPEQQLEELQSERDRLQQEIEYVRARVGSAKDLLNAKLQRRTLEGVRSIDAGRSAVATPKAPVARRPARMMVEDELQSHPDDVLLTVSGAPISRGMIDALIAFQGDRGEAETRAQTALYELIRIEGVAAEFSEGELEDGLNDVVAKLGEGKTVAELVPEHATLNGVGPDGRLELLRNQFHTLRLSQIAFSTEPGTTSRPFRHHDGVVLLHVDSLEKGATPDLDKVVCHALLVPYTKDPMLLQKAQQQVLGAQIDIAVRSAEVMAMLPYAYRDPADLPRPAARPMQSDEQLEAMRRSVVELEAEIEKAEGSGDEVQKGRVEGLRLRLERLSEELKGREAEIEKQRRASEEAAEEKGGEIQMRKAERTPQQKPGHGGD